MILTGDERRYDCQDDAALRLFKCVVMFQNRPLYISNISKLMAEGIDLTEHKSIIFDVNDTDLDLTPPHIGYIIPFVSKGCFYPMKTPNRKQRQGVDLNQMAFFAPHLQDYGAIVPDTTVARSVQEAIIRNASPIPTDPVKYTVSLMKDIGRRDISRPISSDMALSMTKDKSVMLLWHKYYPLGYFIPKERRWILPENRMTETRHEHLQKILKMETSHHEVQSRT